MIPTAAGTAVGTAAAAHYFPQWVFQGPAWSEYLMTKDGTAAGAKTPLFPILSGTVAPGVPPVLVMGDSPTWGDTSVAGMSGFLADQQKYFPAQTPDYYYLYGYCMAEAETAILKKAIEMGDLSRAGILAAKQATGTVDFGGLYPSVTYSSTAGPATRMSGLAAVDVSTPGFLKSVQAPYQSDVAKTLPMP